jgi:hypothetical protein
MVQKHERFLIIFMENMLIRCHMIQNTCLIRGENVYFLTKFVDMWS